MNEFFTVLIALFTLLGSGHTPPLVHLPRAAAQLGPRPVGEGRRPPAQLSAKAYLVLDRASGDTLSAQEPDRVFPIASLTKLATALVVFEVNPQLSGEVTIVATDLPADGKHIFEVGDRVRSRDLFAAMLIASANDAARALARSSQLTPKQFVTRMHQVSRRHGAAAVQFVEPTGLDPQNRATARAVARLADVAFRHPTIGPLLRRRELDISTLQGETRHVKTTNRLLEELPPQSSYEILGGKTGFIEEAGYNLVTAIRGPDGAEVLVVVLGADDHLARFSANLALARWAFSHFTWKNIGG